MSETELGVCEVRYIDTSAPQLSPGRVKMCGAAASHVLSGAIGAVNGVVFVCEEHRSYYSHRRQSSVQEYWIKRGEDDLARMR